MTNGRGHLGLESRIAVTMKSAAIFSTPGSGSEGEGGDQAVAYIQREDYPGVQLASSGLQVTKPTPPGRLPPLRAPFQAHQLSVGCSEDRSELMGAGGA